MHLEQLDPNSANSDDCVIPSWLKLEGGFWLLDEEPPSYLVIKSIDWEKMAISCNVTIPASSTSEVAQILRSAFFTCFVFSR